MNKRCMKREDDRECSLNHTNIRGNFSFVTAEQRSNAVKIFKQFESSFAACDEN